MSARSSGLFPKKMLLYRQEVLPRNAILNDAFELVVFCLVRPKELETAHG
jgi:hypothetical protein